MAKIMIAPSKYVQGPGAIREMGPHVAKLGDVAVVLGSKSGLADCQAALEKTLNDVRVKAHFEKFQGECSRKEIDRVREIVKGNRATVLLAVGGGKCMDAGKAVAHEAKIPCVVIPTIASTDSPCSAVAVIYTEEHVFESYYILPKNPDMVVVDTEIIARAPARFLVAGMGDALSTWFEADACRKAYAKNIPGGDSTEAALAIAHLCFKMLMQYGRQAKLAAEMGAATVALDKIVEANTLLSGLGFESSGLAAAHGVHDGLTVLHECHHLFHGEKVAFGTLTLLVLENREREEIEEVMDFCSDVGLPITLGELGITTQGKELDDRLMVAANATCAPGGVIHNEPFAVRSDAVVAAMKGADALGRNFFARTGKRPAQFAGGRNQPLN
jgi:glycerol dehydrogenase